MAHDAVIARSRIKQKCVTPPLGFDAVIHSAIKYLNGHSDVNAGVVISTGAMIHRLTEGTTNYGGLLDAQACYQLERGLKTTKRTKQQGIGLEWPSGLSRRFC